MYQSELIKKLTENAVNARTAMRSSRRGSRARSYQEGKYEGWSSAGAEAMSDDIYPDWIPMTDQEPDNDCTALVTLEDGTVTVACYVDDNFHTMGERVIAWMPMPGAWKGEKE